MLKVGCRWCDCPAEYEPPTTVYNRFNRWSRRGFWLRLLDALARSGKPKRYLIADKGYDSDQLRHLLRVAGTTRVIPGRRNRKRLIRHDRCRYRDRHLIENAFCRLKDFRRIATRCDKLAVNFLSSAALVTAIAFWL